MRSEKRLGGGISAGVEGGGFPALSHVSWGIIWLTAAYRASFWVSVAGSARLGLNIFPHFANVAQVLQPEPPASSSSLPLHQVHVPLSS